MRVAPRPNDAAYFEAHQLTFETCKFVVAWTEGLFHDDADPRNWRLVLHIGNGVAADAKLGNYIVKHTGGAVARARRDPPATASPRETSRPDIR